MSKVHGQLITYCSNIHPAESWEETFAALRSHVPVVKATVSPNASFPIGLRLSARAAAELAPARLLTFQSWLDEQDCFVPTINGFPYGTFHSERIKEAVYLPDWRSPARREYTLRLAVLLAGLLPEGVTGSISTVPLGWKQGLERDQHAPSLIRSQLEPVLTLLRRLYKERGKFIMLALEPEPGCLLETSADVCRFFETLRMSPKLRKHLGICYDCCHQAVQFEDPAESLRLLKESGVPLAKVQVSSALQAAQGETTALHTFLGSPYLHQVVVRGRNGSLTCYQDLPEALTSHRASEEEFWRCHFHVPIFSARLHEVGTTQSFLEDILPRLAGDPLLEVETYTWDALPQSLRQGSVTDCIIRELRWVTERLHA